MSFKPPSTTTTTRTLITQASLTWPRSRHERIIRDHYFNHALQVFLPLARAPQPPPSWLAIGGEQLLDGSPDQTAFYYDVNLPLTYFIQPEFITQYIRNKATSVIAISVGAQIDQDDVVALDATGHLILNVTKDTYEKLGLDGRPSHFSKRHPQKFVIRLDLTLAAMKPGKKLYDRIRWCFENNYKQPIRFFITRSYQGNYADITFPPSVNAIKKTLPRNAGLCRDLKIPDMDVLRKDLTTSAPDTDHSKNVESNPIFTLNKRKRHRLNDNRSNTGLPADSSHYDNWENDALELREWLGMVACNADRMRQGQEVDPFIAVYQVPEPYTISDGYQCQWKGLITSEHIHRTLMGVWQTLDDLALPWAAVHVWGFADAPVSWAHHEHGHLTSGENNYTFIVWKDGTYLLYQDVCSQDTYN
ncbi:ribonuclease P 40kDa subunit-domain-containing protein [Syncephalis plumigaleata]|nr:ribonuclease P 40kDa subunit-domain-containing protein [Syncephalis plumigaleata]